MAAVGISPELNISEEVSEFLLFMLNEDRIRVPKLSLKQILLAKARPGLSAEILSAAIISKFDEAGIPTGPLAGGATNVMENFVKILSESIVDAIQSDMRIDVVTDSGALVTASGANGGGPLTAVGSTTAPHTGIGVAR